MSGVLEGQSEKKKMFLDGTWGSAFAFPVNLAA